MYVDLKLKMIGNTSAESCLGYTIEDFDVDCLSVCEPKEEWLRNSIIMDELPEMKRCLARSDISMQMLSEDIEMLEMTVSEKWVLQRKCTLSWIDKAAFVEYRFAGIEISMSISTGHIKNISHTN